MTLQKTPQELTAQAVFKAQSIFQGRHAASGTNAPLVVTLEAPAPGAAGSTLPRNALSFVHWSFSAAPTNATLTITDGTVTETIYITAAGPDWLPFEGAAFAENATVTITLSAGGAGISSSLAVVGARMV